MKELSFIIPVYNNAESLIPLYHQLRICCEKAKINAWQIVFVDDASTDHSLEIIQTLHHQFPNDILFVAHSINYGQVGAIATGLKAALSNWCFVLSADLQEPVSLVEEMLLRSKDTSSTLIATRVNREESFFRKVTSWIFYRSLKWAIPKLPVGGFDTFIISGNAKEQLTLRLTANRFLQADVLSSSESVEFITYTRLQRQFGKSQWTFKKKLRYFTGAWLQEFPNIPIVFAGCALLLLIVDHTILSLSVSTVFMLDGLAALILLIAFRLRQMRRSHFKEILIQSSSI